MDDVVEKAVASPDEEVGPTNEAPPLRQSNDGHVRYDFAVDGMRAGRAGRRKRNGRTENELERTDSFTPTLRRRRTRAASFRTIEGDDFEEYNMHPGWQPGQEPGFDPGLPDGGHASLEALDADCYITVVDFSTERVMKRHFGNDGFISFLQVPQEAWVQCRWININGLSWDVIQAVGNHKGLHKLALEDIMNVRNRTKAEWYPNHAFIIMTLQKLVHLVDDEDDSSSSSASIHSSKSSNTFKRMLRAWSRRRQRQKTEAQVRPRDEDGRPVLADGSSLQETSMLRTLQRYHASGNEARTTFMERHSSLAPHNMAVSAEQVSIFLTNDNTVISFFETSAPDVERPIVTRLCNAGTILRESCDASLLVQAIIDAIIDLSLPLTAVYTDIIGDLELDVLTAPSIKQCRSLYICISEINKMLRFLNPVDNLVNVLRDHRTTLSQEQASRELQNPATGVIVTPLTHTYLGDVLDHCIITVEAFQQLKQSSENLISLIFNTISANQSESMRQLTMVTIIFMPLTFITGFFGQNFKVFPELDKGIWYFWAVAAPTAVATIVILMWEMIYSRFMRSIQRKRIWNIRKKTNERRKRSIYTQS